MAEHVIKIDREKCIGCGMCKNDCAAHNIEMRAGAPYVITDDCIQCGHCVAVCPKAAISIGGYEEELPVQTKETRLDSTQVLDVIRFRRTVRQFQDKEIPAEVLEQILEAGQMTHTAKNLRDVSFVVLDKEKDKFEKMAVRLFRRIKPFAGLFSSMVRRNQVDDHFFFFHAPLVIVVTAKDRINGVLAAQNMEFVAEANGLGVLFSGFFASAVNVSNKIKKVLGMPRGKKAAAVLVLGYPKIKYQRAVPREKINVKYL
ncbi:Ferredoxin [uncultured Eubacterium sp.]|nr:Ferredoxin [uncultured Eubacterium sp.]